MPARPIGEKKRTPQAADPTAPPTRRLEQRCAAAAELLYALAGGAAGEASAHGADGGGAGAESMLPAIAFCASRRAHCGGGGSCLGARPRP